MLHNGTPSRSWDCARSRPSLSRVSPAFFVHGFAKSDRENLRRNELGAVRALAEEMLGLDEAGLEAMLVNGTISEVNCDD